MWVRTSEQAARGRRRINISRKARTVAVLRLHTGMRALTSTARGGAVQVWNGKHVSMSDVRRLPARRTVRFKANEQNGVEKLAKLASQLTQF